MLAPTILAVGMSQSSLIVTMTDVMSSLLSFCLCLLLDATLAFQLRNLSLYPGTNMLFPFLPFMIHDFFPDLNRQEIDKELGSDW